jgi:D-amino-acid dehydrogenase
MKRVAVVGGGVIGLCSTYYLRRRGFSVTVIERGAEGHDCCSVGNAGMVVPSHIVPLAAPGVPASAFRWMFDAKSPFSIRPRLSLDFIRWGLRFLRSSNVRHVERSAPVLRDLHLASRKLFEELSGLTANEFGLEKRGLIALCRTQHALDEEAKTAERAKQLGIPAEVISAAGAARLDPAVRMDVAGGVYFPLDCHLSPHRFVETMTRLVKQEGGEFLWSTEATGFRSTRGRITAVTTTQGNHGSAEVGADEFVLAGGVFSPAVLQGLGLQLPMEAGKGYSLTLPTPPQLPRLCSILVEARVAVTPMGRALRVGGTMELAGLDRTIRPERTQGIVNAVVKYFPEFRPKDFDGIQPWYGFRPCSPDGLPYVGRFRKYSNLCAATGHAMLGLSLGPITGKLVSEIVAEERASIAIEALGPDRFRWIG